MAFLTPEDRKARYGADVEAAKEINHVLLGIVGITQDDTATCSCGWKSKPYWDGDDLAYEEWLRHIVEQGAIIRYADGTVLKKEHPTIEKTFHCTAKELAVKIGDLQYDELEELFRELAKKFTLDSDADLARGRKKLAGQLGLLAHLCSALRTTTGTIWAICAPYTK